MFDLVRACVTVVVGAIQVPRLGPDRASVKDTALPCAALGIQMSFLRRCATAGWKKNRSTETSAGNDPGDTRAELESALEPKFAAVSARANPT